MTNQMWKPDKQTRAAISRGSRKYRLWHDALVEQLASSRAERMATRQLDTELIAEQRRHGI